MGGGNVAISDHTIDYEGSGNIRDTSDTTSDADGTTVGELKGNHSFQAKRTTIGYSSILRLGYLHAFTPEHALRSYGTLGASRISTGSTHKNSRGYFAPQTHNLYQVGLALDYMFEFLSLESYGLGVFLGLGYEHTIGEFARETYAVNTQPYGNIGLFNTFGEGVGLEFGFKLPFMPYYSGDPQFRILRTDKQSNTSISAIL